MSFWTAVVAMVAILSFAAIRIAHYNSRARRDDGGLPRGSSPREAELEREVIELRKRLEVLERIATDDRGTKAIAAEIESLRDR
ncbi:MAG: hypothetical protein ACREBO_13790 [Novosphingobium sp.]